MYGMQHTATSFYTYYDTHKGGESMFAENIKEAAKANDNFRHVLYTGPKSQVVVMSLLPGEDIGSETHATSDQILVIVKGTGSATVGTETQPIEKHSLVFVPAGTVHNIINTSDEPMKLYTVYAPPIHKDGTIHKTKADAQKGE